MKKTWIANGSLTKQQKSNLVLKKSFNSQIKCLGTFLIDRFPFSPRIALLVVISVTRCMPPGEVLLKRTNLDISSECQYGFKLVDQKDKKKNTEQINLKENA